MIDDHHDIFILIWYLYWLVVVWFTLLRMVAAGHILDQSCKLDDFKRAASTRNVPYDEWDAAAGCSGAVTVHAVVFNCLIMSGVEIHYYMVTGIALIDGLLVFIYFTLVNIISDESDEEHWFILRWFINTVLWIASLVGIYHFANLNDDTLFGNFLFFNICAALCLVLADLMISILYRASLKSEAG